MLKLFHSCLFPHFWDIIYMQWNTQIMSERLWWWPLSCWWDLTIVYITSESSFMILSNQFPPATLRGNYFLTFVIMNYFCLLIQVNGIIPHLFLYLAFFNQHAGFWDSSSYPRCCINDLFLFVTEQYTIAWIYPQFIYLFSLFFIWSWIYVIGKHGDTSIESLGQIHLIFNSKNFKYLSLGAMTPTELLDIYLWFL